MAVKPASGAGSQFTRKMPRCRDKRGAVAEPEKYYTVSPGEQPCAACPDLPASENQIYSGWFPRRLLLVNSSVWYFIHSYVGHLRRMHAISCAYSQFGWLAGPAANVLNDLVTESLPGPVRTQQPVSAGAVNGIVQVFFALPITVRTDRIPDPGLAGRWRIAHMRRPVSRRLSAG